MPRDLRTRRLVRLTMCALCFALLSLLVFWRRPDTATLGLVMRALSGPAGTDSTHYMRMGEHTFRASGAHLYAQLFFTEHQKFIYPPSSLFLLEMVDWLPHLHIAPNAAWKGLMLICWAASIGCGVLLFREVARERPAPLELACVVVLGVLFLPFAEALYRGQVQMLLTALWGAAVLLFARGKRASAGVLLALTCAFKPQLAVFLLWGVLRRERRFVAAFAATAGILGAVSLLRFGVQNHLDYLAVLQVLSRHGEALAANQSFLGALHRIFRNGDALTWSYTTYPPYRAGLYLASSLLSAACLFAGLSVPWRARWANTTPDFLFFGCVSVLLSPIAWEHHFGYFFFALVALLAEAQALSPASWPVLATATVALSNRLSLLDGLVGGPLSLLGDYLLLSGLAVLALFAAGAGAWLPRNFRSGSVTGSSLRYDENDAAACPQAVEGPSPVLA